VYRTHIPHSSVIDRVDVPHSQCFVADAPVLEPDPDSKLSEPLVVRPTSEAIIWHMFGRWIQSHRDLPLLMNQVGDLGARFNRSPHVLLPTSVYFGDVATQLTHLTVSVPPVGQRLPLGNANTTVPPNE